MVDILAATPQAGNFREIAAATEAGSGRQAPMIYAV
jgi:hypothetical protein